MPKISELHRESRREQILEAALACFSARLCTLCGEAKGLSHSEQTAGRYFMHVRV
jgi:AcrR family transcriptional regulator